jgi:hypothetical protein
VAELVATVKKVTLAETLLVPACKDVVKIVLVKISKVPLSAVTVGRRVGDVSSEYHLMLTDKN